jgi:hypothetical protein
MEEKSEQLAEMKKQVEEQQAITKRFRVKEVGFERVLPTKSEVLTVLDT